MSDWMSWSALELVGKRQCPTDEQLDLHQLAQLSAKPNCRFLEIGSWVGESTVPIAEVAKSNNGILFCLDSWQGSPGTETFELANTKEVFSVFRRNTKDLPVVPLIGSSDVILNALQEEQFDFVYLDADHRYVQVIKDLARCKLLVKPGGILAGHDYEIPWSQVFHLWKPGNELRDAIGGMHLGVIKAIAELLPEEKIKQTHRIWSIRKTKIGWEKVEG